MRLPLAGALLIAAVPTAFAQEAPVPPITRFLPPETHMAFWVDDLTEAREAAKSNPAVTFAMDPEYGIGDGPDAVSRALNRIPVSSVDPLSSLWSVLIPAADIGIRSGIEATTTVFQFSLEDVNKTFNNGVAAYSTLYNLYEADGIEIVEWDSVIAAEFQESERAAVEEFLAKALAPIPASAKRSTAEYSGVDVYRLEYYLETNAPLPGDKESDLGLVEEIPVIVEYAWTTNHLLLAEGRGKPLERSLRAYSENDPRFSLLGSTGYRNAQAALNDGTGSFHFYMDTAHHLREWRDFPSLRGALRMANAFGLSSAGPLLVNLRIDSKAVALQAALPKAPQSEGVFRMVEAAPDNELTGLRLVPADSESFGSVSVDMMAVFQQMRAAQQILSPNQRAATDAVLRGIESMAGVQIERDLLQDSRGEAITYMRLSGTTPEGTPNFSTGVLLPLNGSTEAARVVNGLLDQLSGPAVGFIDLDSTDFEGLRLWESPQDVIAAQDGYGFHFSQTPMGFISTTDGGELREIVRRVLGQAQTKSVLEEPFFERFRDRIRPNGFRGFHYTRSGAVIEDMSRMRQHLSGLPPKELLTRSIGDTFWLLHVSDRDVLLEFVMEAPDQTP